MQKLTRDLVELLFLRFSSIFGEKFSRNYQKVEIYNMWVDEWLEGLAGMDVTHIKAVIDYCRLNLDWSPSIAEFWRIYERVTGVPTMLETMTAAIHQDFYHPIVKALYDKIGSWNIHHDNEQVLTRKFTQLYDEALSAYRVHLQKQYALTHDQKIFPIKEIDSENMQDVQIHSLQKSVS